MKNKGSVWLIVATVVAVGYAYFEFSSEKKKESIKTEQAQIFQWKYEDISEIELQINDDATKSQGAKRASIKLSLLDEKWKMMEPLEDSADNDEVKEFIEAMLKEKSTETIKEEGRSLDWKIFGLEKPKGVLRIKNKVGEVLTVSIADKKNYQGDSFIRRNQEDKILVSSSGWFLRLDKKPQDFRNKHLMRRLVADLTMLSVAQDKEKYSIALKSDKWTSIEHSQWALDQNKVREFIQNLNKPYVSEFLKEGSVATADLKNYGLNSPKLFLSADFKDGKKWSAKFGQDKDKNNFVWISEPEFIVKLTSVEAEKFYNVHLSGLRNRSEPFDFPKQNVKKIELKTALKTTELELKGEKWEVAKSDSKVNIEPTKIDSLLTKLRDLKVAEFIDKSVTFSSDKKTVSLKDQEGKSIFEIQMGETQKKKIDGVDKSVVVAKTNLFTETITIEQDSIQGLGIEEMLAPKVEPKSETEKKTGTEKESKAHSESSKK